jgi:Mn2+/Fe2+ NRAMP family transporter
MLGDLVNVSIDVEVMNSMLLPVVLVFLLLLEARVLPSEMRMRGWWRYTVWAMSAVVIAFGLYTGAAVLHITG